MVRLGDICEILNGYAFKSEKYISSGIRIIRIANVQKGYIEDTAPAFYPIDTPDIEKYTLYEDDLLISLTGNVGRVALLKKEFLPAALNQRVACLRLKEGVPYEKSFIYCFLNSDYFENKCINSAKGVAQKNMSTEWLKECQIPDLSLEEQRGIAKKLDKVSNIIECQKQQLEKLDQLVKSRFIEMFGDPVDNPLHWDKKQLQEVVTDDCSISYGIVQTGDEQQEGVPVFRPIDIVNRIPKLEELKKTTKEISDKYKRTILKGRELLITVRANIADTCVVGAEFIGCNVGRGIVPIRTQEDIIILEFLKHQLDSKHLNDNIKELAKGITLVQLNMEDLRQVELILPPVELQNEFLQFAQQTDKLKFEVKKSLEKLETLKKSLMQQYFG